MSRILVVDDQPAVRDALRLLFDLHDLTVTAAASAHEAVAALDDPELGVVVQDMNFSPGATEGDEGVELFRQIRAARPDLPVLLLTAWTSLETAVRLVKEGAADYLAKPWDDRKLLAAVRSLLDAAPAAPDDLAGDLCGMVVADERTRDLTRLALQVAPAAVPVLITGPNGAGKEKLADILHANSPRRDRPLLKVNVGALPPELLDAELFGAEAGAYTGRKGVRVGRFEAADGGTLFLDEIDSLSLAGQVKLLRALESGEVTRLGANRPRVFDVRVITATNADLGDAIARGSFREDLYFRINVVELAVPPLAERPGDIEMLAKHFLRVFAVDRSGPPRALAPSALAALRRHPWPGNVRELRNRLQRADLLATGATIEIADLDLQPMASGLSGSVARPDPASLRVAGSRQDRASQAATQAAPRGGQDATDDLTPDERAERQHIESTLLATGGVVSHAASALGLSRQALYRRMARLGIHLERRPG